MDVLSLHTGDITRLAVDAIVNAANETFLVAFGPALEAALRKALATPYP
jgi:O-acetyl-ADP-ribose deacetylase (regulator of RNase III)